MQQFRKQYRLLGLPAALAIALVYLLVGMGWIFFSDQIVDAVVQDQELRTIVQTLKGWLYVLATAGFLYMALDWLLKRIRDTQQQLVNSEALYRLLVEGQTDLVVKVDMEGRFLFVSSSYCVLFGKTEEELMGNTFLPLVHEEDREETDRAFRSVFHPPHQAYMEQRAMTKDGWRWLAWQDSAILDDDGNVEAIIGVGRDITEQKKAKEELQYIIDNTHDVIFQVDLEGNYIYVNAASEEITGYPLEELIGKNMTELVVPEHVPMVQERLRKRRAGDPQPGNYSFQIAHRDGHRIWLELTTSGVYDAAGRLTAVQGIARDVTQRKRMEEALEKRIVALTRPLDNSTDIEFRDIFDLEEIQRIQDEFSAATGVASIITLPDGTPLTKPSQRTHLCEAIIRGTDQGLQNCMRSDAALSRYHPDAPLVQPCLSCGLWDVGVNITVGDRHIANWLIGQVRDENHSEEAMRNHARDIGADEAACIEAFRQVPMMSEGRFRQVANALYSLVEKISGAAYMNLQQARFIAQERKRSEELGRLSAAINQAVESVIITDTEGVIAYVNPAFAEITGYSREEAIGRNANILKSGFHDDAFYREMWDTIADGRPWSGQLHNRRKDGSVYVEDATISPVHNESGEIINYVGVKKDITRELGLEEQFRQAQKMEAVGRLASGVAHDFNNILQTILGFCGVLLIEIKEQETLRNDVLEIQNSAKRAGDLTRQLLAFSRKQPAMQQQLDLNQTIKEQVGMLRRLLSEPFNLAFNPASELRPVKADPSQIVQMVMNLVVNARDAMPVGGQIRIDTRNVLFGEGAAKERSESGEYVCLSVADTGTGMEKEVLDHLFEPFYTTKAVGEGTGLGLAVTYGIVEQCGGWIDVESTPGEGSTFLIYIPACAEEGMPAVQDDARSKAAQEPAAAQQQTVLLVEDDVQVRRLAQMMLREAGYAVLAADSMATARDALAQHGGDVEVLLIDAILPDGHGLDLADDLCKASSGKSAIIFSGYSDTNARVEAIERKGYCFLRKPFGAESLLETVETVLAKKKDGSPKVP